MTKRTFISKRLSGYLLLLLLLTLFLVWVFNTAVAAPDDTDKPTWLVSPPGTLISDTSPNGAAGPVIRYSDSANRLIIAYEDRSATARNILFKNSTDDGVSWSSASQISNTAADSIQPTATFIGETAYAAWIEQAASSRKLVFAADGAWPAATPVEISVESTIFADMVNPDLIHSGNDLHIVWSQTDTANFLYALNVFHAISKDSGGTWSISQVSSGAEAREPDIAIEQSNKVHVVWEQQRAGSDTDIYYAQGAVSGASVTWTDGFSISTGIDNAKQPNVIFDGNQVQVAFTQFITTTQQDIYLTTCVVNCDKQTNWSPPTRLLDQVHGVNDSAPFTLVSDMVYEPGINTTFIYYHGTDINGVFDNEFIWGINSCDNWTRVDEPTDTAAGAPAQTRTIEPTIAIGDNHIQLAFLKVIDADENQVYHMRGTLDMWDPFSLGDSVKACPRPIYLPTTFKD